MNTITEHLLPELPLSVDPVDQYLLLAADGTVVAELSDEVGDTPAAEYIALCVNQHIELVTLVREFLLHAKQGGTIADTVEAADRLLESTPSQFRDISHV